MNAEDKEIVRQLIDEAVPKIKEAILLETVNVMGALMQEKIARTKIRDKWLEDNKEFLKHRKIVEAAVSEVELKNPGKQYQDILDSATPEIVRRIGSVAGLDMTSTDKPKDRTFKSDHGTI